MESRNLGKLIEENDKEILANSLEGYINSVKQQNPQSDLFYLECLKDMLLGISNIARPFDKEYTAKDKRQKREENIKNAYDEFLSSPNNPRAENWQYEDQIFKKLQTTFQNLQEVKQIENQLNSFWQWYQNQSGLTAYTKQKQGEIKQALISAFVFQIGSFHFTKTQQMPQSMLLQRVGLNLYEDSPCKKAIAFIKQTPKFPANDPDLVRYCEGGLQPLGMTLNKVLEDRIAKLRNHTDFKLMTEQTKEEILRELYTKLLQAASDSSERQRIIQEEFQKVLLKKETIGNAISLPGVDVGVEASRGRKKGFWDVFRNREKKEVELPRHDEGDETKKKEKSPGLGRKKKEE